MMNGALEHFMLIQMLALAILHTQTHDSIKSLLWMSSTLLHG